MNKVITVNLNGKACQLEEGAHDKLRSYMDEAARNLAGDPGMEEILTDLERALAEKCERFLTPAKNVVTVPEIDQVLKEMGPVESSGDEPAKPEEAHKEASPSGIKRLYRLKEEGVFTGVCAGLAAYFGVDPAIIRLLFALLTMFTSGSWLLIYFILIFIMPRARTEEQKAAAFGEPFTAKDWVDRVKWNFEKPEGGHDWRFWRREVRQKMRNERRARRSFMRENAGSRPFSLVLILAGAALSLIWFLGLIGLVSGGAAFGWGVPAGMPLWAALLVWSSFYALAALPLRMLRRGACCEGPGGMACGRHAWGVADSLFRMILWTVLVWAMWRYLPGTHTHLEKLAAAGNDIARALVTP